MRYLDPVAIHEGCSQAVEARGQGGGLFRNFEGFRHERRKPLGCRLKLAVTFHPGRILFPDDLSRKWCFDAELLGYGLFNQVAANYLFFVRAFAHEINLL